MPEPWHLHHGQGRRYFPVRAIHRLRHSDRLLQVHAEGLGTGCRRQNGPGGARYRSGGAESTTPPSWPSTPSGPLHRQPSNHRWHGGQQLVRHSVHHLWIHHRLRHGTQGAPGRWKYSDDQAPGTPGVGGKTPAEKPRRGLLQNGPGPGTGERHGTPGTVPEDQEARRGLQPGPLPPFPGSLRLDQTSGGFGGDLGTGAGGEASPGGTTQGQSPGGSSVRNAEGRHDCDP